MPADELVRVKLMIHQLRNGVSPLEIAKGLERSVAWVYKWRKRFFRVQDWHALEDQSRRPEDCPRKLPDEVRQAIRKARSELEAEAGEPGKLSYIGAQAVQARLRKQAIRPLPSISSIERELRAAHMTCPKPSEQAVEVNYPHLHPTRPLEWIQADIVPHYLPGGDCVNCFNAIDVVSHYPTGQPSLSKYAEDALAFLVQVWQEMGLAEYTQVDNEGCFSGGFGHPGVLGQVLRLALFVGTQLVFSPIRHPQSNGTIERFHQDYLKNVWEKIHLPDLQAVKAHSPSFFDAYRHSEHHSELRGRSPADLHPSGGGLPADFALPKRLPITVGQVHFIRRVNDQRQIMLLNLHWDVPLAQPNQGVWATLEFALDSATVRVFDAAPDAPQRMLLAEHPFPVKEPILPLAEQLVRPIPVLMPNSFPAPTEPVLYHLFGLVSTML